MKKLNLFIGALSALTLITGVTSCGASSNTKLSTKEIGHIEALTSIKLVESSFGARALRAARMDITPELEADVEKILPSLDVILNAGHVVESTIDENGMTINDKTYAIKETISYYDSTLNTKYEYVMAYDKTILNTEEDWDDKWENKFEKDEIEESYLLNGVVILSETEVYDFVAKAETEIEGNEVEFERFFKINIDKDTYVLVEEENEKEGNKNEVEFAYTLHKPGEKDFKYSISIEDKKGKRTEIEYELNGVEYEVKMVDTNGVTLYHVEVENNNDDEAKLIYKKVVDEEGNVTYERVDSKK